MIKSILTLLSFCVSLDSATNGENKGKFLGEWGIYQTHYNGSSGVLCNVCPAVVFDDDLTAIAQLGNVSQGLNWELLGDLIILTNQLKGDKSYYIESGDYTWKMENKGKFSELYLKPEKGTGGYLLRR